MKLLMPVALVALTLALTACETTEGSKGEAAAGTNRPPDAAAPAEPTAAEPEVEEPAADAGPLKFGETFTYENGVSISVGAPTPFKPSEYAAVEGEAAAYLAFPITIVNGSTTNLDVAMWHGTLQSANTEAEKVYDSESLGDEPSTTLLPGREATFKVGYGVQNPNDLVFEVTPGIVEYEDAFFTS